MANTRSLRYHLNFIDLIGIRFYLADTYSFSCYNDLKEKSLRNCERFTDGIEELCYFFLYLPLAYTF